MYTGFTPSKPSAGNVSFKGHEDMSRFTRPIVSIVLGVEYIPFKVFMEDRARDQQSTSGGNQQRQTGIAVTCCYISHLLCWQGAWKSLGAYPSKRKNPTCLEWTQSKISYDQPGRARRRYNVDATLLRRSFARISRVPGPRDGGSEARRRCHEPN